MHPRSTRLLAALPVAVAAVLVLAPAAHATTTPQPSPPPIEASPAPTPIPASAAPSPPPAQVAPAERPGQVSQVPVGAPETGGGATADDPGHSTGLLVLGGLGLAGAGTALALRRRTDPTRAGRG
ncbi:hypothetical protein [Pseudonocardia humida]|uniref:LPXTG-motif cell wall-anchored protein n=1 Tax=Pseudonocardia humida TaxID=2800819 RepID=A0ABT0ZVE5_9PSEU|nr:hypothetical protein [Pseudonocardia humida]MCO1654711.1 hypothetical protein [Pseudonocardia humida]